MKFKLGAGYRATDEIRPDSDSSMRSWSHDVAQNERIVGGAGHGVGGFSPGDVVENRHRNVAGVCSGNTVDGSKFVTGSMSGPNATDVVNGDQVCNNAVNRGAVCRPNSVSGQTQTNFFGSTSSQQTQQIFLVAFSYSLGRCSGKTVKSDGTYIFPYAGYTVTMRLNQRGCNSFSGDNVIIAGKSLVDFLREFHEFFPEVKEFLMQIGALPNEVQRPTSSQAASAIRAQGAAGPAPKTVSPTTQVSEQVLGWERAFEGTVKKKDRYDALSAGSRGLIKAEVDNNYLDPISLEIVEVPVKITGSEEVYSLSTLLDLLNEANGAAANHPFRVGETFVASDIEPARDAHRGVEVLLNVAENAEQMNHRANTESVMSSGVGGSGFGESLQVSNKDGNSSKQCQQVVAGGGAHIKQMTVSPDGRVVADGQVIAEKTAVTFKEVSGVRMPLSGEGMQAAAGPAFFQLPIFLTPTDATKTPRNH